MASRRPHQLAIAALITITAFAGALAGGPVEIDLLTDDGDRIVLRFRVLDYDTESVLIDGQPYAEVRIPGEPVSLEAGAPALPHVNRSVILPDQARMGIRVLQAKHHDVTISVAPSKGNLLRTVDPVTVPHEFGPVYQRNAFYPHEVATLGEPYVLRDHRGAVVRVNPFRYNPVSGVLRVYTDVTVEVFRLGTGGANPLSADRRERPLSRAFHEIYGAHFVNYGTNKTYNPLDEVGEMLILCNDDWIPNMTPFVDHKATAGIVANVVGISTVGNNPTSIQNYIQSVYDGSDLAFVLLVGDIAHIDSPEVYTGEWGASDASYSKLAGGDDYPDVLVGRFSASSAAEVDTQVQRSIEFETPPATEQDWFWRATGIASDEGGSGQGDEGQSDIQHESEIRAWLLGAGYTQVDQVYDPGATDTQVANALNAGRGLVNYTGHGNAYGWGTTGFNTTDVNNLTNAGALPFVFSVACNNGQFEDYASCFAETWMRTTHGGEPSGAAAVYASSVSQSWSPPMEAQDEFNLLLTDPAETYHSLGALAYAGSCSMMDDYGSGGVDMFDTWVLFGDPSLRFRGTIIPPEGMTVSPGVGLSAKGAAGEMPAPGSIDYTLRNFDETPIDYSVSVSAPWMIASETTGTLPPGGSAVVTVSLNDVSCNLDHGRYDGTVRFFNMTRHEGDTERAISLQVGVPMVRERWDLEQEPGWTMEGRWDFGQPGGIGGWGYGNPDPSSGATGDNVYGTNLSGDITPSLGGPWWLTTGPVDLTASDGATLSFQRWLNIESNPPMGAMIEVSDDGTTWHRVWSNDGGITDDEWKPTEVDISDQAAGRSGVYVRWGYEVNADGGSMCSGWNLDDIELWTIADTVCQQLTVDTDQLSWTPVGTAVSYEAVQGDLDLLRSSGGDFALATQSCLADDLAATSLSHGDMPGPGEGIWMLVRGVAAVGPLSYQSLTGSPESLRDAEIAASGAACP